MVQKTTRKITWWQRLLIILCAVLLFAGTVLGVLQLGVVYTEKHWDYFTPDYEKVNILPLLEKKERTEEDYRVLYEQTGLTKLGIDGLIKGKDIPQILRIQEYFFSNPPLKVSHFAPFTYLEEVDGVAPLAVLEDGDIIVSATTRVSWWRYGHATLVINGVDKIILEASEPKSNSHYTYANTMANLGNFLILRPKVDEAVKAEVVKFACDNLYNIPYSLTTGIFSKKYNPNEIKGTQCAHLVWYAYKKFGVDLDSDGGLIIKPRDMARSEKVEIVQAFGFDLKELW